MTCWGGKYVYKDNKQCGRRVAWEEQLTVSLETTTDPKKNHTHIVIPNTLLAAVVRRLLPVLGLHTVSDMFVLFAARAKTPPNNSCKVVSSQPRSALVPPCAPSLRVPTSLIPELRLLSSPLLSLVPSLVPSQPLAAGTPVGLTHRPLSARHSSDTDTV